MMGIDPNIGVPIGPEMASMQHPGAHNIVDQIKAESGMEQNAWPIVAGAALALGVGASLWGGKQKADAAARQAEEQNKATKRQHKYNKEAWKDNKEKIKADRDWAAEEIELKQDNARRFAAHQDTINFKKYAYDLQIRNAEQASLNAQYQRSGQIYSNQTSLNSLTARAGAEDEHRKLREIHSEAQFDSQEQYIESLVNLGQSTVQGGVGRSASKSQQSVMAGLGRRMAMIDEGLDSASANSRSVLAEITRDKSTADLAAYAQKMLHPGTLPLPIQPTITPFAKYLEPRKVRSFDYGPKPVKGAHVSVSAARQRAWGETWSGIGSGLTSGAGGAAAASGSDILLKENIIQIGTSSSGLNIYEWNYIGDKVTERYRGVIAQDLINKGRQDAVTTMENGYLGVYYDKIDVNMERI